MQVRLSRQRRRARIDDHEHRAAASRFLDERDEVDAGSRRVDAPQHDQPCVEVVLVRHPRHLAVERPVGCARGRGADRSRKAGRAERRETTAHRSCPASKGRSIRHSRTGGCPRPRWCRGWRSSAARSHRALRSRSRGQRFRFPWLLCGPPDREDGPPRTSALRSGEPSRRCNLRVDGFASAPSILTTRPRSTVTSSEQESGQSNGQAVRTVECPHDSVWDGRAIRLRV